MAIKTYMKVNKDIGNDALSLHKKLMRTFLVSVINNIIGDILPPHRPTSIEYFPDHPIRGDVMTAHSNWLRHLFLHVFSSLWLCVVRLAVDLHIILSIFLPTKLPPANQHSTSPPTSIQPSLFIHQPPLPRSPPRDTKGIVMRGLCSFLPGRQRH